MPKHLHVALSLVIVFLAVGRTAFAQPTRPVLEGVININTASAEELRLLPGVGPAKIRNVLAYRQAHAFRTVEELARVKGIGRKMVRKLRMHLAVSGPTTAQRVLRPVVPPDAVTGPAPLAPTPSPKKPAPPSPARPEPARGAVPMPSIVYPDASANHCPRPG